MAQNKKGSFGPTALTTSIANLLAPAAAGASAVGYTATADYLILTRIRILNKDSSGRTFSLYIGATGGSAAGTEFMGTAVSIPANSYVDWVGQKVLAGSSGFLTGLASANSALVIEGDIEIGHV